MPKKPKEPKQETHKAVKPDAEEKAEKPKKAKAAEKIGIEKAEKTEKKPSKSSKGSVQPEVNIGLVGHVDHGKTTLTERLSGKWTDTHSEELKRGITIRLGYADAVFRKCTKCKGTDAYTTKEKCPKCGSQAEFVRKVSFVDAPGHESLMATMLSGAMIMDGALLLVAANESCPQPQTREHLMALDIVGVKKVIVVQNKIDLVGKEQALKNYNEIKKFLSETPYKDAPIIPISAQHSINIDLLIETIEEYIPTPKRDETKKAMMLIARSFDINKPGSDPTKMVGGVLGGAIIQGKLSVGEEIELRPGRKIEKENKMFYEPVFTKITGIKTGGEDVNEAKPGGSIGVLTRLDPSIVKSDTLVGNVVGHKGNLPMIWDKLTLETHLLKRVVGAKRDLDVDPIKVGEILMLNVNSAATVGVVSALAKDSFKCNLKLAVCADAGAKVAISRRVANRFRLIGYGTIKA
ncbi:translation initiation factor IF-2 subunit gamma [Candidatus Woesearchaeota archaeon CG10_big_fil_rev_8_21_14_0_10_44_13]|nr:MAG: translation initiation factor IF-2 subunit gamma [Candidatus Woesearchaeota archaeon CG10_big_fil_rev_8_21_14_0_10_44_13]